MNRIIAHSASALRSSRRGTTLVLVLGALALVSILVLVYVAIGKADRRTQSAVENAVQADEAVDVIADYLVGVIGDDALATAVESQYFGISPDDPDDTEFRLRPRLVRESTDYAFSHYGSVSIVFPIAEELDRELVKFNPAGSYELAWDPSFTLSTFPQGDYRAPSDPWLASSEPEDLVGFIGSGDQPYANRYDWPQISNFAPDGLFVNLRNLRGNFRAQAGLTVLQGPGDANDTTKPRLSDNLSLAFRDRNNPQSIDISSDQTPWEEQYTGRSTTAIRLQNTPAVWQRLQLGAFRPIDDGRDWGDLDRLDYQWADADGDGMADSRWFQLYDASDPNNPKTLMPPSDYRFFIAARAIDLSGLINVNTATDSITVPGVMTNWGPADGNLPRNPNSRPRLQVEGGPFSARPGAGPFEVDLRRLLTGIDLIEEPNRLGYNDLEQPGPGEVGDYSRVEATDAVGFRDLGLGSYNSIIDAVGDLFTPASGVVAKFNTGAIGPDVDTLFAFAEGESDFGAPREELSEDVRIARLNQNNDRSPIPQALARQRYYEEYGGRPVSGDSSSPSALFGVDDLSELLTYWGTNDDQTFSRLEQVMAGRYEGSLFGEAAGGPKTKSPLRSDRPLSLERRRGEFISGELLPSDEDFAWLWTDPRHLLTPHSGAVRRFSAPLANSSEVRRLQTTELKRHLNDLVLSTPRSIERVNTQRLNVQRYLDNARYGFNPFFNADPVAPLSSGDLSRWSTMIDLAGSQDLVADLGAGAGFALNADLGDRLGRTRNQVPYELGGTTPQQGIADFQYWTMTRELTEQAFGFYADLLLPFAAEEGAWPNPLSPSIRWNSKSTEAYGYRGPELALRLAAHAAVNFRDHADSDDIVTAATLLIDGSYDINGAGIDPALFPYWAQGDGAGATSPSSVPYAYGPGIPLDLDVVDGLIDPFEDVFGDDDGVAANRADQDFTNGSIDLRFESRLAYTGPVGDGSAVLFENSAINVFGIEAQPFITQVGTVAVFADADLGGPGNDGADPNIRVIDPADANDPEFLFEVISFEISNPFDVDVVMNQDNPGDEGDYWWIEYNTKPFFLSTNVTIPAGESVVFYATNPTLPTIDTRVNDASMAAFMGNNGSVDVAAIATTQFGAASSVAPVPLTWVNNFDTTNTGISPDIFGPGAQVDNAERFAEGSGDPVETVLLWRDLAGTNDIRDDLLVDRIRDEEGAESLNVWPAGGVTIDVSSFVMAPGNNLGADGATYSAFGGFRRPDDANVFRENSAQALSTSGERPLGALPAWALEIKSVPGGDTPARSVLQIGEQDVPDVTTIETALADQVNTGPGTRISAEPQEVVDWLENNGLVASFGFDATARTMDPMHGLVNTPLPNPYRYDPTTGQNPYDAFEAAAFPEYLQIQSNSREFMVDPLQRGWPIRDDLDGVDYVRESETLLRVGDMLSVLAVGAYQRPLTRFNTASLVLPMNDPRAGDAQLRMEHLDREWTTLGEAAAIALGYGGRAETNPNASFPGGAQTNAPFDVFDFLGGIGLTDITDADGDGDLLEPSPFDRPILEAGTLRTDDFVLFTDNNVTDRESPLAPGYVPTPLFNTFQGDARRNFGVPAAARAFDIAFAGGELASDRYGDLGRPMTGLVNINTAPLRVLRTLPMLAPPAGTLASNPGFNISEWWADAVNPAIVGDNDFYRLGLHSQESDIAATVLAYRDKRRVFPRANSAFINGGNTLPPPGGASGRTPLNYGTVEGFINPASPVVGQEEQRLDRDPFDNNLRLSTFGLNETVGFASMGELMALRAQTQPNPATQPTQYDRWLRQRRHLIDVVGTDQRRIGQRGYDPDAATPLLRTETTPLTGNAELDLGNGTIEATSVSIALEPGGSFDRVDKSDPSQFEPEQIVDDIDEKYMVMNALSNSIATRSDYYAVWFLVHGYRESDVAGLDQADRLTDPLLPSYRARYLMVVDRSNVLEEGDEPRVVLFRRVPL